MDAVLAANPKLMSAVSLQELGRVIAGRFGDRAAWAPLDALLARLDIEVVAHDAALAYLAREALSPLWQGPHPAGLNFGDCAAYALARANNLPLLFKGEDFPRTDIVAAVLAA